jgi:hypothetical protein
MVVQSHLPLAVRRSRQIVLRLTLSVTRVPRVPHFSSAIATLET